MSEKLNRKRIGIDFDGVLHAYRKGWQNGVIYDDPVPGAVEAVQKLVDAGYDYFVFTTRVSWVVQGEVSAKEQYQRIRDWLIHHRFPLAKLVTITAEKLPAVAYIDDRAVRFTNWEDVRKRWT